MDHETAILELEGQVDLLEKRVRKTFVAVLDTMETKVQERQRVVAELGKKLERSVRDLKKQWDSRVTELEDENCKVGAGWHGQAPGLGTCRQEPGAMG